MTLDEETLKIYEEMKTAIRDGDLLTYAGKLARGFVGSTRREDTQRSETGSNPNTVRPSIPQPNSIINDRVRVANL